MNPVLEQLHDIEGIDPISWWPLAIGWWVIIGLSLLLLSISLRIIISRIKFKRSWKHDALKQLALLERNLSSDTNQETLIALSDYLKRIVLKRFPRKECASLTGKMWLNWLTQHDPNQFDWNEKGMLLIQAPYAPTHTSVSSEQIKNLIQAVRNWIR
ncbi:MAG: DUF4381 domain-containing protein [Parachlamydiaceae bacterium]